MEFLASRSSMLRRLAPLGLLILAAAAFLPALQNGFVSDDHYLIRQRATYLQAPDGWKLLTQNVYWWSAGGSGQRNLYRPWVSFTFWLETQLGGVSPSVYHLSNYMVHLANTALVLALFIPLLGFGWGMLAAALTAVSPVVLTSVGWISGRTDLWAAFFSLLFLLLFRAARRRGGWVPMIGAAISFFFALCSKEAAIVIPAIAWAMERSAAPPSASPVTRKAAALRYLWLVVPLAAYLYIRSRAVAAEPAPGAGVASMLQSVPYWAEEVLRTILRIVLPVNYDFFTELAWSKMGMRGASFLIAWIAFLALIVLVASGIVRKKLWAAGAAWFGTVLFVAYGFGQTFAPVADFYAYLAVPGFFLFAVDGVKSLVEKSRDRVPAERVMLWTGVGLVALSALLTFVRLPILRTDASLAEHMIRRQPGSVAAHVMLAGVYISEGQPETGLQWLEKAALVDPTNLEPRLVLAKNYLDRDDIPRASPHVDALWEYGKNNYEAWTTIGRYYYKAGRCGEAVEAYGHAFMLREPRVESLYDYGMALLCLRQDSVAVRVYENCIARQPYWPNAYNNLGIAYENLGDLNQAEAAYETAVAQDATLASSWESLAIVALRKGDVARAKQMAARFFALDPPPDLADGLRREMAAAGIVPDTL